MPPTFRYRYVDIGTVFTGDSRRRDAQSGADSPSTLFANELACDVGGTTWGANEPLAILDHHLPQQTQFPSACAAVLHKSRLIRDRFAQMDGVVWLVTHKEPDFDAFCSMYLARWLVQDPTSAIALESYGLHPEGWLDLPTARKIDWLNLDLGGVPTEHRWALLLASYASILEMRRHIPCPRERGLRSILYAALKRGRDYLNATSGATEFFDEVRARLTEKNLNPVIDSVLEGSATFAPELAMLDREAEAYPRDLQRASKALVYLPEAEAPSPDFFEHPKHVPELDPQQLLLADSFRIATDGIFLRDPECALFKEWARVDVENSSLGAGFEFTAIAQSHWRPEGVVNTTEYAFAIDPERANGRHLYTVWSRLETEEVKALRTRKERRAPELARNHAADGSESHPGTVESLLSHPWLGGQSRSSTIVDTPPHGTIISPAGVRSDLRDDPVAEAVRTELEAPIYISASLVEGPQVTVYDLAATRQHEDAAPRHFDLNARLEIVPPQPDYFRFASIGLRSDVPIAEGGPAGGVLARQIGENLWHTLHPERPGEIPQDFDRHLLVRADAVGVWSERGVAVAQKSTDLVSATSSLQRSDILRDFMARVGWVRDVDRLAADWSSRDEKQARVTDDRTTAQPRLQALAAKGEDLTGRALDLQHTLTLPQRELLRRFCEAIGFEQIVARLRDLNQAAAENLRRAAASEETRRQEKRSDEIARVQRKTKWLQVLLIGFVALEIAGLIVSSANLPVGQRETLVLFASPVVLGCAAWLLHPWRAKRRVSAEVTGGLEWILILGLLVWFAAWLAQVVRWW
jgi:hypothetical protein